MFHSLRFFMMIHSIWMFQVVLTYYQSTITLSSKGVQFLPLNSIELLSTIWELSFIKCRNQCNQNPQCRTFDFDTQSTRCRLFEGAASTGQLVASTSLFSQVGCVVFDASLYSAYGLSCDHCHMNRYLLCVNQVCTCPPHTYWNGLLCENQKYAGSSCSLQDECRLDSFNFSCSPKICSQTGISQICSTGVNLIPFNLTINSSFPYSMYTYNFTAIFTSAIIVLSIQRISWYWYFDDFSLKNSNGSELLINGGFEMGSSAFWNYCNPYASPYSGSVFSSGSSHTGTYYWVDAAQPNPDFLAQNVSLTIGETYTFSFWLQGDGGGGQILVNIFQN